MPADQRPADSPDTPPTPVDAHATGGMGWVMPVWLIAFLVVVVFGVISYLIGWWFQQSAKRTAAQPATSQTRMVSYPPAAAVSPSGANATAPTSPTFQSKV
jgi:hypothetical protein